jgi:hypothetical protein
MNARRRQRSALHANRRPSPSSSRGAGAEGEGEGHTPEDSGAKETLCAIARVARAWCPNPHCKGGREREGAPTFSAAWRLPAMPAPAQRRVDKESGQGCAKHQHACVVNSHHAPPSQIQERYMQHNAVNGRHVLFTNTQPCL